MMYTLTVTRGIQKFRFFGDLPPLIQFAGEWDSAFITDIDGIEMYSLSFYPKLIAC